MAVLSCLVVALGALIFPAPDGPYAVGVARAEFVNGSRHMPAVVWYPAQGRSDHDSSYLSSERLGLTVPALSRNLGYTESELSPMTTARLKVRADIAPLRRSRAFPLVVFSHGLFLYPEQNSELVSRLASHGYIVVSIAHPGDSADVRLEDGSTIATKLASEGDDPRFAKAFDTLVTGPDLEARRGALTDYAAALPATRLGRSLAQWRSDTLFVAEALIEGKEPQAVHRVLVSADRNRLAFAGMSFGGATAATSCRLVQACRAAVNLDGQNFDPDLFDHPVERPLLLMLSDWTRYNLFKGQTQEEGFSPNDLAYESWASVGEDREVVRVRLKGSRHMGFTDMVALLDGAKRDDHVGEIEGGKALSAIGDLVVAFLDVHVRGADSADFERAIERHPEVEHHAPSLLKSWMGR